MPTPPTPPPAQTLYVGDAKVYTPPRSTSVYALDAQRGTTRWHHILVQYGNDASNGFLQIVDGVAYTAHATSTSYADMVEALQTKDGHLLWQYRVDQHADIHTMRVCSGVIYLGITQYGATADTTKSIVEALRAKDAKLLWRHTNTDSSYYDQLEVTSETLYLITAKSSEPKSYSVLSIIHALRSSDGSEVWHATYNTYGVAITATATDHAVYVIKTIDMLKSGIDTLQASDGSLLWHKQTTMVGPPFRKAVANGLLYLDANDQLCAFSLTDGKQIWCRGNAHDAALQASVGVIYTTSIQPVCAVQASNGKTLWCVQYPNLGSTIIASESIVYVASNFAGTLYALRKSDGTQLWYRELDHFIFALALE